jgi:RNA polymerase sigma-70 factor (ECF subfamily)
VVVVIVLNVVRLETLVAGPGSSGAICIMMFDARRKLRAALAANGYMGHHTAGSS